MPGDELLMFELTRRRVGAMSTTVKLLLVIMLLMVVAVLVLSPARETLLGLGESASNSTAESFIGIGDLIDDISP